MSTSTEENRKQQCKNPYDPNCMSSLKHWGEPPAGVAATKISANSSVDCGWGRLIFGQTYTDARSLAKEICKESKGRRDIAMYMRDPHVVMSYAPQDLFLDPSLTYRLDFQNYRGQALKIHGLRIRPLNSAADEIAVNTIYQAWNMVPARQDFYREVLSNSALHVLVAEDHASGDIVGAITGVDHFEAFGDPDNGSSFWALAVDRQCRTPRVGETLIRELILTFIEKGRRFIDLSVMHSNNEAKALYDKLGFQQVPVYCIKKKNSINEPLFIGPKTDEQINIYAKIIVDEARRRGIGVEILDAQNNFLRLSHGGRIIDCRESLSELTSAVAMSRCDDKSVTRSVLAEAGLKTPDQQVISTPAEGLAFLQNHRRIVVKPARGEQGEGVFVDLRSPAEVEQALECAAQLSEKVIAEEFVEGDDLRIIVIDDEVVAAAIRKPPSIVGTGEHTILQLIEKQSRRRAKATNGESSIPVDEETKRCVKIEGYELDDLLPENQAITVRKTANLHTGGTIHDVTDQLHPYLVEAAVIGAKALDMPVVGFDFLVPSVSGSDYVIVEANERPGLANHEPQPTAERFIDLLFPQTRNHL